MSAPWTAEMDQRLLLAYVATNKSSAGNVAEKWTELYSGQNIPQRTKRAIVEHILKLKKSIGLLPSGSAKVGGSARIPKRGAAARSQMSVKTTVGANPVRQSETDRDNTERALSIKTEAPEASHNNDGTLMESGAPRNAGKTKGKGKKIDSSSSEVSMSESETEDEVVLPEPQIKTEDDDFLMPQIDENENATSSPKRIQHPRQVKAKEGKLIDLDEADEADSSDYYYLGDSKSVTAGRSPSPPAPGVPSDFDTPPHVSSEITSLRQLGRKRKYPSVRDLGPVSMAKKARKSLQGPETE